MTGKVWSALLSPKGTQESSSTLHCETIRTPELEVTRVLLAVALLKDLTLLFCDISVVFLNTPMPEGDPVYVEPAEGLYEDTDMVWCPKKGHWTV